MIGRSPSFVTPGMSLPETGWPLVESLRLVEIREALRRRSKAIGNKVRGWTCDRLNTGDGESLLVRMDAVSLRVWADGVIWVNVAQESSAVSFHARMDLLPPEELVAAAEGSLLPSSEEELLARWRRFQPHDVVSGSRRADR